MIMIGNAEDMSDKATGTS